MPPHTSPAPPSGPFAAYLLVLHNIREERRYLYAGYYELFWDVWETHVAMGCDPVRRNCVRGCGSTTLCLTRVFQSLESLKRPPPAGALWIHADLWINPGLFPIERLDRRKVWMTDGGLLLKWRVMDENNVTIGPNNGWRERLISNRCLEGGELYGHFMQTNNWLMVPNHPIGPDNRVTSRHPWLDRGLEVLRRPGVQALPALRGWGQSRLCFGWVDILYIPFNAWPDWTKLAPHFSGVFHECAAYTMLSMLVRSGRVPGAETIDFCRGDCCHGQDARAILSTPCGHKMNLRNERERNNFERMLRNYTAAQRSSRSAPR